MLHSPAEIYVKSINLTCMGELFEMSGPDWQITRWKRPWAENVTRRNLKKKTFHHSLYGIVQQLRIRTHFTLRRHIEAESTKASGRVWKHRHFSRIAWIFISSRIFVRINEWVWCDNNWCCLPPKWTIFLWIQHKARCWSQRARLPAKQGMRKLMYLVSNHVTIQY